MLGSLRDAAGSWLAKGLLSILVLSFAVWGISGRIAGVAGHESVVTVGGTSVSVNEYRLAYDRQVNALSQQYGQRITQEQAKGLGIDSQVLAQLVSGALLDEQARQMGLGVSKDKLAELTRDDDAFKGPDGKFDRVELPLAPRGAYHLSGEARHLWEHSIAPMDAPRWSVTFRSLVK